MFLRVLVELARRSNRQTEEDGESFSPPIGVNLPFHRGLQEIVRENSHGVEKDSTLARGLIMRC